MAKEVKSSFGTNGLKKTNQSRSGRRGSSRDGSDSDRHQPHVNNSRIMIASPTLGQNHKNLIQNPGN